MLFIRQRSERRSIVSCLDDISGCDNILESVSFGHVSAFLSLATNHQDGVVSLCHFAHGRVATDELARVDFQVELVAEIEASLFLCLSAAVGQENIRTRILPLDVNSPIVNRYPSPQG